MCPVCITAAVLVAGKVTSSSVLATIAVKTFGVKNAVDNHSNQIPSKEDHHG